MLTLKLWGIEVFWTKKNWEASEPDWSADWEEQVNCPKKEVLN